METPKFMRNLEGRIRETDCNRDGFRTSGDLTVLILACPSAPLPSLGVRRHLLGVLAKRVAIGYGPSYRRFLIVFKLIGKV